MPIPFETLPGIYLGAASLICLLSYFGARARRMGYRRHEREGDVTRLWLQWLAWNRSMAPEGSAPSKAREQEEALETPLLKWPAAASARNNS